MRSTSAEMKSRTNTKTKTMIKKKNNICALRRWATWQTCPLTLAKTVSPTKVLNLTQQLWTEDQQWRDVFKTNERSWMHHGGKLTSSWSMSQSPVMTMRFSILVSDRPPFKVCNIIKKLRHWINYLHMKKKTGFPYIWQWTKLKQLNTELSQWG